MLQTKTEIKRTKSKEEALCTLMNLCARAERSSGDAIRLMRSWGVAEQEQQLILQRLLNERFIDDRRFAEAFVRDKLRLSAWGRYKIAAALKRKSIADHIIQDVLQTITPTQNIERLQDKLQSKLRHIKYNNIYELKTKLIRYSLSIGFTMEEVMEAVDKVIKQNNIAQCDEERFY